MFHERMSFNSPLVTAPAGIGRARSGGSTMARIATAAGTAENSDTRELIGEAETLDLVGSALQRRVTEGITTGAMSGQASAVARLFLGQSNGRRTTIAFELAGSAGAAWTDDDGELALRGDDFLMRQVSSIGGGTTEMAANVVAERVLGFPRERSMDRDVPFRDVPRGASNK
jgi:alkylation response protein AidB-like acyl-CoA dehydrogenase